MTETVRIRGEEHAVTQCGNCGVWHTVPLYVYIMEQRKGGFHYCPNGHTWGWLTGTEKKERDAIRQERDRLKQQTTRLEEEATQERRRADVAEKRVIQLRRRAAAGVCPCCNRTFVNVQRHMATKHKNVVPLAQKTGGA